MTCSKCDPDTYTTVCKCDKEYWSKIQAAHERMVAFYECEKWRLKTMDNKTIVREGKVMNIVDDIFRAFCIQRRYNIPAIRSRRRQAQLVTQRVDIAKYLRGLGYSYPVIGRVMNRHHSSIMMLVNDELREKKRAASLEYARKLGSVSV